MVFLQIRDERRNAPGAGSLSRWGSEDRIDDRKGRADYFMKITIQESVNGVAFPKRSGLRIYLFLAQ
jgi:hypothetical protein